MFQMVLDYKNPRPFKLIGKLEELPSDLTCLVAPNVVKCLIRLPCKNEEKIDMIERINGFLASISNWLTAISVVISFFTLATMLCFNRRLRKAFEKKDFADERKRIIKQIGGFSDSLIDGIYDEKFLDKIDSCLVDVSTSFTFFSIKLRFRLWWTSFCINHRYKKEIKKGTDQSRHRLSLQLRIIRILVEKE